MSILELFRRKPQPLTINVPLGTFTLQNPKKDNSYEGSIKWLDTEALVDLDADSTDSRTADKALASLHKIVEETARWDRRLRELSLIHI